VACSLCADGYFEQFGLCVACPKSSGTSIGALFGLSLLLVAICGVLYVVRELLPIDVIKLGVSMVQIIASANSAYDIPWPSAFRRFLSLLRVFLVDVVAITQASCAQPMSYYASMMVVCVGLKLALALLLLGPWAWSRLVARGCRVTRVVHDLQVRRKLSRASAEMSPDTTSQQDARVLTATAAGATAMPKVNWTDVFKASFMLLFIAYPGVSLKVLRLFKCREIEGEWWLAADMRLRCYDGRWAGFAIYGLTMAVFYIVGLPAAVLWILWRRRHKLFGSPTDPFVASTRATFGFLYVDYGDSAWWWEVEELARKLLLSAVVVLIDEGSPLQVTLAVLISGWAHVLHAQYKPWGAGSVLYSLQHGALFVTSFVFLMGLLFKVDGVSSSSGTYSALSGIMVTLCVAFMTAWVAVIALRAVSMWRDAKRAREGRRSSRTAAAAGSTTQHVGRVDGVWSAEADTRSVGDGGDALGMGRVDAAAAAADSSGVGVGATSHGRSARGFVVDNPLRRPSRGTADDGATPHASAKGSASDSPGAGERSPARGIAIASQPSTTAAAALPRLRRVLTAQRPVLSMRICEAADEGGV
jgi:hypothetical protein